jgi:hypothetical protein
VIREEADEIQHSKLVISPETIEIVSGGGVVRVYRVLKTVIGKRGPHLPTSTT